MNGEGSIVLTIGHSNHPLEVFLGLLARHRVTALADVRSAPYSRFNFHFNREPFAATLDTRGIRYVYLGRELGGRSDDRSCYENGRIRYDRLARTDRFREGLDRVMHGVTRHRIALMCAEKEPLDCHRTLLVGRALDSRGVKVEHILADGELEPHAETMDRLLAGFDRRQTEGDMFREEFIEEAISHRTKRVGHAVGDYDSSTEQPEQ